jgi:hypothetical protein
MLAAYAAILATITATIKIMNLLRDRRRIKLSIEHVRETFDFGTGEHEESGEMLTIVSVGNAGRRPVTITRVGVRLLFPSLRYVELNCNPKVPLQLSEGKHLSALFDQERHDLSEVEGLRRRMRLVTLIN